MHRSRLFWRLYVPFALLLVASLTATGVLVSGRVARDAERDLLDSLRAQSLALGSLAERSEAGDEGELAADVARLAELTGRRITVVRRDGTVAADSLVPAEQLENHADRAEIRDALAAGIGLHRRDSASAGVEMLYAAHVPDHASGRAGVVRVATEAARIHRRVRDVSLLFGACAVATGLLACWLGALAARRVSTPLEEMRRVADGLSRGDYGARVAAPISDELGALGSTLNQLGDDMSRRVSALTAGQDRLRAMVAGMVEGVVAVDDGDRITFTNHTARQLLGLTSQAEQREERLWEAARVPDLPGLLSEARRSDAAAQRELSLTLAGREVVVRAQAHRFNDGDRVGVVVVLHDITELRRLERIRRDFVANVSHELKTPLTSIRGFVEALMDGALQDEQNNVRFLEKIDQNVERLSHLVTDLLSLARIEAQEGVLKLERVDLHALLEQAHRRHEPRAVGRDQALRLDACTGALQVLGDREALTQVIDNLVDNALKYTPVGGRVTIRVLRKGDRALLEVEDDGIGIPSADLDRIFERFYRVDKARSRAVGGTGLGLSIVKHLVSAMHGEVEVESVIGKGTLFRVSLEVAV